MTHRVFGAAFFLALSMLSIGCDGVPDLTFAADDATASDVSASDVAASDVAASDATASDATASDVAGPGDTGAVTAPPIDAGCPGAPPAGATACCGSVPCNGDCDAHCSECKIKCTAVGDVCCAKTAVTCHAPVCN